MKILVINWQDWEHPSAGGAEVHLREVYTRLARKGHEVTVVACGWRGAPRRHLENGVRILRVGNRLSFLWQGIAMARRLLARRRFDVLVEDLNKVPLFAPLWSPVPVTLLVHHLFGATAFRAASPGLALLTWLLERPLRMVYGNLPVHVVSSSTALDLLARGFEIGNIAVIHNGADVPDDCSADLGRGSRPNFLYLGRLERYKGIDLVIKAFARMRRTGIVARLIIAGRGRDRRRLERLTRRLGLKGDVEFAGYVSESEKRVLLTQACANVLTSPREGWGISIAEAAAVGTPSIASDSPGLRDSVQHRVTGLLVPHGDVVALADAMTSLARNEGYRDSLGASARRWRQRHSWNDAASYTERYLLAVVEGRSPMAALPAGESMPFGQRTSGLLIRMGPSVTPYGATRFAVRVNCGATSWVGDATVGAVDPDGANPVLTISLCSNATDRAAAGTSLGICMRLAGWPLSGEELVRRVLVTHFRDPATVQVGATRLLQLDPGQDAGHRDRYACAARGA